MSYSHYDSESENRRSAPAAHILRYVSATFWAAAWALYGIAFIGIIVNLKLLTVATELPVLQNLLPLLTPFGNFIFQPFVQLFEDLTKVYPETAAFFRNMFGVDLPRTAYFAAAAIVLATLIGARVAALEASIRAERAGLADPPQGALSALLEWVRSQLVFGVPVIYAVIGAATAMLTASFWFVSSIAIDELYGRVQIAEAEAVAERIRAQDFRDKMDVCRISLAQAEERARNAHQRYSLRFGAKKFNLTKERNAIVVEAAAGVNGDRQAEVVIVASYSANVVGHSEFFAEKRVEAISKQLREKGVDSNQISAGYRRTPQTSPPEAAGDVTIYVLPKFQGTKSASIGGE